MVPLSLFCLIFIIDRLVCTSSKNAQAFYIAPGAPGKAFAPRAGSAAAAGALAMVFSAGPACATPMASTIK
jgi:hypothetical protein